MKTISSGLLKSGLFLGIMLMLTIGMNANNGWASSIQIIQTRDYRVVAGDVTVPVDLVFDQFDPRLGTLLDVEAVFQFTEQSASIDYENTGGSAAADIQIGKVVNYVGPGLLSGPQTSLIDSVELFKDQVNFGAFDGVFDFAGPDSFTFRQTTPAGHTLSATPTTFSPYVGTGTVPLEIVAILGTSFGTPPNLRVRINGDELSGIVTYRYEFAPAAVPEPSTLTLFSIGTLFWLGVTVLRRLGLAPHDQAIWDVSAVLLPDTVDPRGPKGGK